MTNKEIMERLYINADIAWADFHTGQTKSVNVVYEETEYVIFAEDKPVLDEVQRKLELADKGEKVSPKYHCPDCGRGFYLEPQTKWHTGTPTEEGWYLIAFTYEFEEGIRYTTDYFKDGKWAFPMVRDISKLRAWQRIEHYKEENNG